MGSKRNTSFPKKTLPVYYIFCEGETEEAYVSFLKQEFRVNIKIKSKVAGQNINQKFIKNHIKEISKGYNSPEDKTYLMYDVELTEIKNRLSNIQDSVYLFSNPNIELWFLLHFRNQKAFISSNNCIRDLKGFNIEYQKPKLNQSLEKVLEHNFMDAIKRAKGLPQYDNPSTSVYLLLEEILNLRNPK